MKKVLGILVIALVALAFVSSSVFADGCPMMGKCCMKNMSNKDDSKKGMEDQFYKKMYLLMSNSDEIGLSAEQLDKIRTLKYSVKKGIIKSDAEIDTLAVDIKAALGKDEVDLDAVNALIDKKYAAKAQKTKDVVAACASLKTILTEDQEKKMKEMCSKEMKDKKDDKDE